MRSVAMAAGMRAAAVEFMAMLARGVALAAGMSAVVLVLVGGTLAIALTPMPARAKEPAQATDRVACDPATLSADVGYFSSDRLEGRGLGSQGLALALRAVAQRFADLGLEPGYPEKMTAGDPLAGYFQDFTAPVKPATANVIGILRGSTQESPRAVVLGAHVDHLGRDESLTGDRILNGADDNASGVAALLAIARSLALLPSGERDRDVIFIAFSGEESGLLGSRYYAENPIVPASEVIAMVNLDTIGRLRNRELIVFGSDTAREFPALLAGLNQAAAFTLALRSEGAGASDQTSFFAENIPVLHLFTGPHEDYHRAGDEAAKINVEGLAAVANYAGELVRYLRYRARPLTFVPAGKEQLQKMNTMAAGGERRVSLGFMPDFASEANGVKVGPVTPGGAAARAGIQPGDIITAIDGEACATLVDYTALLRQHAPGERVRVTLQRAGQQLDIEAEVQERR
jgi:aminopeptidase N